MKIFDMPLTLIKETSCFKYYKAIGYGKNGYDYRENKDGTVEFEKGGKWIPIDGKIESEDFKEKPLPDSIQDNMLIESPTICIVAELKNGNESYIYPFYVLAKSETQAEEMVKEYLINHKESFTLKFDELIGFHPYKGKYGKDAPVVLYDATICK